MTIAFSIKRIRSSSDALREEVESSSPCKISFFKSNTSSEHQRRSSLCAIFQNYFRISTNEQQKHASAFENDALFERYRYRQQQKRSPPYAASPPSPSPRISSAENNTTSHSNHTMPNRNNNMNDDDDDGDKDDNEPPPRVICRPEEKRATGILINKHYHHHHRHRHTSSLQTTTAPPMANHPHHRRSRTATHIRHFSSSNITAHSEDLTAKEFADIAGIKILPDDVDTSEQTHSQPLTPTNTSGVVVVDDMNSSINLNSHILLPHHTSSRHQHHSSGITTTTMTTATTTTNSSGVITPLAGESSSISFRGDDKQPHIWDDAFWRSPDRGGTTRYFQSPQQQQQQPQQQESYINAEENNMYNDDLPPVVREMWKRNIFALKLGRFEVHLHQTPSTAITAEAP